MGGVCSLFGAELLGGLAELVCDFGVGEEAGEGGVRDGVVGGEAAQRLAARAAAEQLRVGDEPA